MLLPPISTEFNQSNEERKLRIQSNKECKLGLKDG